MKQLTIHHINTGSDIKKYFKPVTTEMDTFPSFEINTLKLDTFTKIVDAKLPEFTKTLENPYRVIIGLLTAYMLAYDDCKSVGFIADIEFDKKPVPSASGTSGTGIPDSSTITSSTLGSDCPCCKLKERLPKVSDLNDDNKVSELIKNKFKSDNFIIRGVSAFLNEFEMTINANDSNLDETLKNKDLYIKSIRVTGFDTDTKAIKNMHDKAKAFIKEQIAQNKTDHRHIVLHYILEGKIGKLTITAHEFENQEILERLEEGLSTPFYKGDGYTVYINITLISGSLNGYTPPRNAGGFYGMHLFGGLMSTTSNITVQPYNRMLRTADLDMARFVKHHGEIKWIKGLNLDGDVLILES